ncbi:hypothetical protein [Nitrosopumilus sp.]|uniref:hypothetical protein n=1 Tax=Nitrosopumilus sp. TaxID=2024843 RepID=UPI00247DFFEC|nr:hypothetical protein [Nitrosopumilus sp.]MCV0430581.1 hypothetical protein [Nitrosopumilus sp.]
MEIKEDNPIVLFDNQCYLCIKFAKIMNFFSRGKLKIIGHYSEQGKKIRDDILDDSALQMFWFITKNRAYGGRAALIPLFKAILVKSTNNKSKIRFDEECNQDCKTIKAVFVRSTSLITNSKTIELSKSK